MDNYYSEKENTILLLIQAYCINECCEFPTNCNENCVLRQIEKVISEELDKEERSL